MSLKKEPLFGPYVNEITYNTTIILILQINNWTQPDRKIHFGSEEQGKHLHRYHLLQVKNWTYQPNRRTNFGSLDRENTTLPLFTTSNKLNFSAQQ